MKRIVLFIGALWAAARFGLLYYPLSAEISVDGGVLMETLLFSLGSMHAVMAAGYLMSGFFTARYGPVIKLLTAGQVVAVLSDAGFLLAFIGRYAGLTVDYGLVPVFPLGLSLPVTALVMAVADIGLLVGLLLQRDRRPEEGISPSDEMNDPALPEVNEVTLEEE